MIEFSVLLPEIFLSLISCIMLMVACFSKCNNINFVKIIFAACYIIAIYLFLKEVPNTENTAFYGLFKTTEIIKSFKILIIATSFIFIFLIQNKFLTDNKLEFFFLLTLSIIGMLCMLSANNFLSLYVSLELQSLSLYVLAVYEKDNGNSSEAGLKYFILGSFASGLLLFGISLIYGFTGNLNFDSLNLLLASNSSSGIAIGVIVGIIMVMIGLFFKISAAPFHMWTPDVYQGSPTLVTAFFATVVKIASVGVLLNLSVNIFGPWKADIQPILLFITSASVLIGAIGALKQTNIKRLLAYSSIGHIGFILLAISALDKDESINTVFLYLIIYISMTLATFAFIMNLKVNNAYIVNLEDLSGMSKKLPLSSLSLAILMFSLAGIPPLAGFFAKFFVFKTAISNGLYLVSVISIIAATISAYYYLKIVKIMYFDEGTKEISFQADIITKFIIIVITIFNLLYILVTP